MWRPFILGSGVFVGLASGLAAQPKLLTPPGLPAGAASTALPEGAIVRLGSSRFNHGGQVTAITFSPDSRSLVSGGNDGMIRIWDVATGQERRSWRMNSMYMNTTRVQYSGDGKLLAASSTEGLIRVWDADGVNEVYVRNPPQRYDPGQFCWVGKTHQLAISGRTGKVEVLEVPGGRRIRLWSSGVVNPQVMACSPDGKQLVVAGFNSDLKSYDLASGKPGVVFEKPQAGPVVRYRFGNTMVYSPDSKYLIGGGVDRAQYFWNTATGKVARHLDSTAQSYIYSMAISRNGRFLATSSSDGRLRIIGLASGAELRVFNGVRTGSTNAMAYSPDGRYVASIVNGQSIRIWDVASGKELYDEAGHRGPVLAGAFLRDGRVVTAGQDQTLRCWDPNTGKELDRLDQQPIYAAHLVAHSDGRSVLLASNQSNLLKWTPGKNSDFEQVPVAGQGVITAIADDAQSVVSQSGQNLAVYAMPSGKLIHEIPGTINSYPQRVCVSAGARYLAYLDYNMYGTIHIWDLPSKHERRTIVGNPTMPMYAENLLFSPDGRLLVSVASNRSVLVWEVFTGLARLTVPQTMAGQSTAAFSPDGRFLAVGSAAGEIHLIDMRSGASSGGFAGHRGRISDLAFSADGKRLISASADTTAVIWDVAKLQAKLPKSAPAAKPTQEQLDDWWLNLASGDGRAASEAIWSLVDEPGEALSLFRDKLKPVIGPNAATIENWVNELDSPQFRVREQAYRRLASLGESARAPMALGLKRTSSAEARARLHRLLRLINSQVSPEKLRPLRALEVLEKIGGPEARQQLETLAKQSTDEEIRAEIDRVLSRWK
jgi:WD40 repeat protein